jgi:hypothetical protein
MRNISDKSCGGTQNKHYVFDIFVFENHSDCEMMWKTLLGPGRPRMTTWRMRIACWMPKATNIISEYVILQQWFHERASLLRYTSVLRFKFSRQFTYIN